MKNFPFAYLTKEGVYGFVKHRLMSAASVIVLIVSMVLVSSSTIVFFNIDKMLSQMEAQNVIMAFLEDDLSEPAQKELGKKLTSMENVQTCRFVSREEAWQKQVESLGDDASILLEGIDESPLPDAYKITLKNMNTFRATVDEVSGLPGVLSVRENSELASQLTQVRRIVSAVAVGAFILFSVISLGVTATTLSLAVSGRRREIGIMKSVGATDSFIRLPFIVQGVLYGILASFISLGIMYGVYQAFINVFSGAATSLNGTFLPFNVFVVPMLALFLAYGILVGVCGSWISMRKYLKKGSGLYGDN